MKPAKRVERQISPRLGRGDKVLAAWEDVSCSVSERLFEGDESDGSKMGATIYNSGD